MTSPTCPQCGEPMTATGGIVEYWIGSEPTGEWYEQVAVNECSCGRFDFVHIADIFVPDTSHDEYRDRP
jgi:hypothetical protein